MRNSVSMRFPVTVRPLLLAAIFLRLLALKATATTYYVDVNSTDPVPPFTNWCTASTDIQSAVNLTTNGDLVLVNDGIYQSGGYTAPLSSPVETNCVVVTNTITLQSVNGPATTLICGSNSMSCIYLANGAILSGFTLTNGLLNAFSAKGGGAYCASTNTVITNCVFINNSASQGGGAYSGTLINCMLQGNSCYYDIMGGGGAAYSTLLNCAILDNQSVRSAYYGGVCYCTLSNCIIAGNSWGGVGYSTLEDCTIEKNTGASEGGEPIAAGGATQSTLNHCLLYGNQGSYGGGAYDCVLNFCVISNNAATTFGGGVYYDGQQTSALGQSNIVIGNTGSYAGGGIYLGGGANFSPSSWTIISNSATGNGGGIYSYSSVSNCTFIGNYSGGNGGGCCYSSPESIAPVSDCTFVDNVAAGDGGGAYAYLTNCYVIGNRANFGGGVYGTANNCIINSNVATNNGGGLYADIDQPVFNCAFTNNSAMNGGGAYVGGALIFSNCVFWANSATNGGGIYDPPFLFYCVFGNNYAELDGGGIYGAIQIANCLLTSNSATFGGGVYLANTILDSTIANNQAADNGGGIYSSTATNCIIYGNSAPTNMNYGPANALSEAHDCCTIPLTLLARGVSNSNFTNNPAFVNPAGGDFHLQSNSPCINSGNNASVVGNTDLDGNPRIVGGTVDIGAYEYQTPVSMTSYYWLQQYGLSITPNTDTSDLDGTPFDVYQDWIAGLNPTNPASVLVMLPPKNNASGVTVSWESVSGIEYNLLRTTNLTSTFTTIQSNIGGQTNTTSYTDTTATNGGPYFYQVAVP